MMEEASSGKASAQDFLPLSFIQLITKYLSPRSACPTRFDVQTLFNTRVPRASMTMDQAPGNQHKLTAIAA